MLIISHRGYWLQEEEKNSEIAFRRSFNLGFGTETDLRDHNGKIVISHDIPVGEKLTFEDFLKIFCEYDASLPLALNIKADGLQEEIKILLEKYNVRNYFVFDMSIPDTIGYFNKGLDFFTRESEFEQTPAFYDKAQGAWMDCFKSDWIKESDIEKHFDNGKKICVVSPDLHKREYLKIWEKYKSYRGASSPDFILCTDYPEKARDFFKK